MADNDFLRDFSGNLVFAMDKVAALSYPEVSAEVVAQFHLVPESQLISDFGSLVFQDFRREGHVVELAWEIWMGFTVGAKTPASEPLVRDIAAWLLTTRWAHGSAVQ